MADIAWNGSTSTLGGQSITPLNELHAPDEPAQFKTTGATDSTHTTGTGMHKLSVNVGFHGSHFPPPGTVITLAFQIGVSGNDYTQANAPGTPSQAFATQVSVSGRKDGSIDGTATLVPADGSLTPVTQSWSNGDLGFDGSSFSFNSSAFTGIVAAQYTGTCEAIDSTGAEAGASSSCVYNPGIPEETIVVTCLGPPQCAGKAKGATSMSWTDGGTLGTSPSGYTAECVGTRPGGQVDGQATTEHTFKWRRTGSGNS